MMVPLTTVFWIAMLTFGVIGALRGWVRELLVTLAIISAYFLRWLFLNIIPFVREYLNQRTPTEHFYFFTTMFIVMALFGYAGPGVSALLAEKARREKIQDLMLGFFVGAINGYLLVGTIWGLLAAADYAVGGIQKPDPETQAFLADQLQLYLKFMPLSWMSDTLVLILTGVTLIVVLVVLL